MQHATTSDTRAGPPEGLRRLREAWTNDPRITGYLEAREAKAGGAASAVRERELLPGYLTAHAELASPARRKSLMRELVQDFDFPLGAVLIAFQATADEAAYARDGRPLQVEVADELARLRSMPYDAYLKSDHWRKTRARALARAEGRCQIGGRTCPGRLHVHHRDQEAYARRGQERPADLTVLCRRHHEQAHGHESGDGE